MKLENIGFYTLSDYRALNSSITSPLWRCEIVLTDLCNFKCPYCRGLSDNIKGTMPINLAMQTLKCWFDNGLKNVRFTGGEPTILQEYLLQLVTACKNNKVERIAISTNGSASIDCYQQLLDAGVNDFSISLDSGCCSVGDAMSGVKNSWNKVVETISFLKDKTYLTVGMVFTEQNVENCVEDVLFADSLGVSDVRVIPSAQYNKALLKLKQLPENILNKYPILKYRINNLNNGITVRGMSVTDSKKCWLMMDDMAVAGGNSGKAYHYPCIIYLREGGKPVGEVGPNMRQERLDWIKSHNCFEDSICKKNCLDVCRDFCNKAKTVHG